jgi:integrase
VCAVIRSANPKAAVLPTRIPTPDAAYQNARTDAGRALKTINGELSVLRQVLKRARLWYRFEDDYRTLRNSKPPVGRALTAEEQQRLFEVARTRPEWLFAYVAATLSFYCGLRACEIKGLRWQDIDLANRLLHVRRSKTPAGWRSPTLNATCLDVLETLHEQSAKFGFTEPAHFLFPWHGRDKRLDPTRAMTSWRSAWRSVRKAAGLLHVRFHDGRHTAITTLAEKGLPDWVIQAQVGHVAPEMMKAYSHIRRQALNQAADALEPTVAAPPIAPPPSEAATAPPPAPPERARAATRVAQPAAPPRRQRPSARTMSHGTSQNAARRGRVLKLSRKIGSSGWTRTSNPPVNRLVQVLYLVDSSCFSSPMVPRVSWCSGANCSLIVHSRSSVDRPPRPMVSATFSTSDSGRPENRVTPLRRAGGVADSSAATLAKTEFIYTTARAPPYAIRTVHCAH